MICLIVLTLSMYAVYSLPHFGLHDDVHPQCRARLRRSQLRGTPRRWAYNMLHQESAGDLKAMLKIGNRSLMI